MQMSIAIAERNEIIMTAIHITSPEIVENKQIYRHTVAIAIAQGYYAASQQLSICLKLVTYIAT